MHLFKVNFKGIYYCSREIPFLGDLFRAPIVETSEVPSVILNYCETEETSDNLILYLGDIIFSLDEENKALFDKKLNKTITFNKKTFKAEGEKLDICDFKRGDLEFYKDFSLFLNRVISLNSNIHNHLIETPKYLKIKPDNGLIYNTTMKNFYNLLIFNFSEYEKIINSDSCSILEANLSSKDFSIEEASKLSQAMGLPKFALNTIKELDLEGCLSEVRNISKKIDGNSLKILFTFIDRLSIIFKKNVPVKNRTSVMKKFLMDIEYCLSQGYKVTDLLNYLLRQNLYFTNTPPFGFPFKEAMYLADYIKMANKFGIKIDKYPSQLKRQHDILSKNLICLEQYSEELEKEFIKSVNDYSSVEKLIQYKEKDSAGNDIIKEYLFLVPKCIKDIIEEGTNLHHCVSSYSDRIINKTSRVVFMREKNNPKQSFITIDIDEDYNLVEAKKAFNEDVDLEYQKVIDKWLKEIKK